MPLSAGAAIFCDLDKTVSHPLVAAVAIVDHGRIRGLKSLPVFGHHCLVHRRERGRGPLDSSAFQGTIARPCFLPEVGRTLTVCPFGQRIPPNPRIAVVEVEPYVSHMFCLWSRQSAGL